MTTLQTNRDREAISARTEQIIKRACALSDQDDAGATRVFIRDSSGREWCYVDTVIAFPTDGMSAEELVLRWVGILEGLAAKGTGLVKREWKAGDDHA